MSIALRRALLVLLGVLLPLFTQAAPAVSAHDVIQNATTKLLSDLKANKETYRKNPESLYSALNGILGPAIDAEGISRSIMTVKYSHQATPEQISRFEENFKRGLIQFYGNALLEYNDQVIRVLPQTGKQDGDRTSVAMEVVGTHGEIYPVTYTMVNLNNEWRVRNIVVNGINLGKLYRDQFAESMQRNGGDLDKTINNWGSSIAEVAESPDAKKAAGQ